MISRYPVGIGALAIAVVLVARRGREIARLICSGRPAGRRVPSLVTLLGGQLVEVIGPGTPTAATGRSGAHALIFWGFIVLLLTVIEAYGSLFSPRFALPWIGHSAVVGFVEDLFTCGVLLGIVTFAVLRLRTRPARVERASRFYGSHLGAAWLILVLIAAVMLSLVVYRGAQVNTGEFPYPSGAFLSDLVARALAPLGRGTNRTLATAFVDLNTGVIASFLVVIAYSKHLHIVLAPVNIALRRRPGRSARSASTPDLDPEHMTEDVIIGAGEIQHLSRKQLLDLPTCTECGRCQEVCPAWATGKALSPKLVVMDLRDELAAAAPRLLHNAPDGAHRLVPDVVSAEALWACTTCGACVEACPVDIEHVDSIVDLRRYQVLMESKMPRETATMLRNIEARGDPWGLGAGERLAWTAVLESPVNIVGETPGAEDAEYLLWVGCAGAFDDRARQTTQSLARLLDRAGVSFAVLGRKESCTGDPARRAGNEYLFQTQAARNIATLDAAGTRKIVASCAHCFNTLANEYPFLGGNYEVLHHTQLLARLVAEGRLAAADDDGVTVHDPCYLARHNRVVDEPRSLLSEPPIPRWSVRRSNSFCCGAGGARMWMEENEGSRINLTRFDEALATGARVVATACPYCTVMLDDARRQRAAVDIEVVDLAVLLERAQH